MYFNGYNVPEEIKIRVLAIMKRFTITGLCDGMYIANVIAHQNGMGDGLGFFNGEIHQISMQTAEFLINAYGSNIAKNEKTELFEILNTGKIDRQKAKKGINSYIKRLKEEKTKEYAAWGESARFSYLNNSIKTAYNTIAEL